MILICSEAFTLNKISLHIVRSPRIEIYFTLYTHMAQLFWLWGNLCDKMDGRQQYKPEDTWCLMYLCIYALLVWFQTTSLYDGSCSSVCSITVVGGIRGGFKTSCVLLFRDGSRRIGHWHDKVVRFGLSSDVEITKSILRTRSHWIFGASNDWASVVSSIESNSCGNSSM